MVWLGQQLLQVRRSILFGPPHSKLCNGEVCVINPGAASYSGQLTELGLQLCFSTHLVSESSGRCLGQPAVEHPGDLADTTDNSGDFPMGVLRQVCLEEAQCYMCRGDVNTVQVECKSCPEFLASRCGTTMPAL